MKYYILSMTLQQIQTLFSSRIHFVTILKTTMNFTNNTKTIWPIQISQIYPTTLINHFFTALLSLFVIVGLYKLSKILYKIINPLSLVPHDLECRYIKQGIPSYALITGGSEGIGLAFAIQLAKRNFNIVIMSRSEQKLKKAQQQIKAINPKITVKYFAVDFQKLRTQGDYQDLYNKVKSLDISILVNNVGVYNPELFLNISYAKIKTETILNTIPMTIMSRIFIPIMKQRYIDFKKRSAIINVASGSCQSLLYGTANYCATKAYEDLLTRSLATEYRNYHIDFMSLRPYLVTSSMTYGEKSLIHVTGEECAKGALKDLGRSLVSYGHWKHRIQGVLIEELNGKIVQWFMCLKNKQLLRRYKELGYTGK